MNNTQKILMALVALLTIIGLVADLGGAPPTEWISEDNKNLLAAQWQAGSWGLALQTLLESLSPGLYTVALIFILAGGTVLSRKVFYKKPESEEQTHPPQDTQSQEAQTSDHQEIHSNSGTAIQGDGANVTQQGNHSQFQGPTAQGENNTINVDNRDTSQTTHKTEITNIHNYPDSATPSEEASAEVSAESTTQFLTSIPRNPQALIGRKQDLQKIQQQFEKEDIVLLINGLGGIGKTSLAREFIQRFSRQFKHVGWVNYANSMQESLVTALNPHFKFKGTPAEIFPQLCHDLENLPGQKLLIIDNLDNKDEAQAFRQMLHNFKILITSRLDLGYTKQTVDVLSPEEATQLFVEHHPQGANSSALPQLLQTVGSHTLMTELVAKTCEKSLDLSVEAALDLLEKHQLDHDALAIHVDSGQTHQEQSINAHLTALFDVASLSESQLLILKQFSLLPVMELEAPQLLDFFQIKDEEKTNFTNDLNHLVQQGWLIATAKGFFCHQIIQDFIHQNAKPQWNDCEKVVRCFARKLKPDPGDNPLDRVPFLPFAVSITQRIDEEHQDLASLYNNMALRYKDMGQLPEALEFSQKALTIYEAVLEEKHPSLATSYNNVALIYNAMGQLPEALEFSQKALTIHKATLDEHHPIMAACYNNMATIYKEMGQLSEALEFNQRALTIREAILDEKHPDLATSYNNMAALHQDKGQLPEALEFSQKTLAIFEAILDEKHPSLATSYNNMATLHKEMGQLPKALEFNQKALTIFEAILDEKHPTLATSYNNMAQINKAMGKLPKALEFNQKALTIRETILDEKHPLLATSYNNMARIYQDMGQLPEAVALGEKAVRILEHLFPQGHPNLDVVRRNLEIIRKELEEGEA